MGTCCRCAGYVTSATPTTGASLSTGPATTTTKTPGCPPAYPPDPPKTPSTPPAASTSATPPPGPEPVSYTHLRAHETRHDLVCRLLLEKKKKSHQILHLH